MKGGDRHAVAREAASRYFLSAGYTREAELAASGEGDDFPEVRIAVALLDILDPAPRAAPQTRRNGRRIAGEEC